MVTKFKVFESDKKFNVGDIVVLLSVLSGNFDLSIYNYRKEGIYQILTIDSNYCLTNCAYTLPKVKFNFWVGEKQIRLATFDDIDNFEASYNANKYNL